MQEQVSSHRTGLPDRLLRLFAPRAPLPPYKGPPKRPPKLPYTGVAQVGRCFPLIRILCFAWQLDCRGIALYSCAAGSIALLRLTLYAAWRTASLGAPPRRYASFSLAPLCSTWSTLLSRGTQSTNCSVVAAFHLDNSSLPCLQYLEHFAEPGDPEYEPPAPETRPPEPRLFANPELPTQARVDLETKLEK